MSKREGCVAFKQLSRILHTISYRFYWQMKCLISYVEEKSVSTLHNKLSWQLFFYIVFKLSLSKLINQRYAIWLSTRRQLYDCRFRRGSHRESYAFKFIKSRWQPRRSRHPHPPVSTLITHPRLTISSKTKYIVITGDIKTLILHKCLSAY